MRKIFTNQWYSYLSIKTRLFLLVLLVIVVSLALASWQSIKVAKSGVLNTTVDQLRSDRESKARQLENYFEQIRNQVETLSTDFMVVEAVQAFSLAFASIAEVSSDKPLLDPSYAPLRQYYQREFVPRLNNNSEQVQTFEHFYPQDSAQAYLQNHYIALNDNLTGQKNELISANTDRSAYRAVHEKYHPVLKNFQEKFGFYDIFLIDQATGNIVYSVFKEVDFATSLIDGPFANSNLGTLFRDIQDSTNSDVAKMVDFSFYQPSYNQPASFIASPVFDGEEKVGTLIFQISIDKVNEITTGNKNWYLDGHGETGENILVGSDGKLRSQSRFLIEQPESFTETLKKAGHAPEVIERVDEFKTTILSMPFDIERLTKRGHKGQVERFVDYRGKETESAYVALDIPDVDWWLVTKIDSAELSQNFTQLFMMELLNDAFFIFLLLPVTYWFIGKILTPLNEVDKLLDKESTIKGMEFSPIEIRLFKRAQQLNQHIGVIRTVCEQVQSKLHSYDGEPKSEDIIQIINELSLRLSMELEWLEERYKKAEAITQRVQKNWLAFDSESGKDIDSFSLFKQKFVAQIDSQKNTIEQLKLTMAKLARLTLEVKSLRYVSNGNDGSEDNENTQCMNRELKQVEELCFQTREQLDVCIMQAHYSTEALLNACHILGHSQLVNSEGQPLNPIAIDNMEHSLQELTRLFVDAKFRDDIAFSESARAIDKLFESKSVI